MANNHPFFSLPPELHTEIFTLTCSPSPTRVCTAGPSYYTAFTTGISLSRVSKYVNAASAPARYRSVVLYGWQEMLGFERMLAKYPPNHSRVRYMTLVADELPQDPSRLLTKESYPLSAPSSSNKLGLERLLLDVIARILRAVGKDLYELEIGFQAIEHVKDPLAYLSLPGPLCFPNLATMFYACSPSNTLPWGTPSSSLSPSPFSLSSPVTPRQRRTEDFCKI
ncbi:hypothetical protein GYMLUDRAFT_338178 [Collybiopsis luxurians FD-317 M1]|nr:hypothetical protein GYMLUDRAFT_338178 [Collybiopsis luxurians FD-317 M1]